LSYNLVPLMMKASLDPRARPIGWVAKPYLPTHTMTSYFASVVLPALVLSAAKNISTHTFAFIPAASTAGESVVFEAVLPTEYDHATSKVKLDILERSIGMVLLDSNLAFGNACTGSVSAQDD
jgi:hypothetical protein